MKINWDYKVQLAKLHEQYNDKEVTYGDYVNGLVMEVKNLIKRIGNNDKTLTFELECWVEDIGHENTATGEFEHTLDDGDEEELEYRLNELYDIGDSEKRVWFGF